MNEINEIFGYRLIQGFLINPIHPKYPSSDNNPGSDIRSLGLFLQPHENKDN